MEEITKPKKKKAKKSGSKKSKPGKGIETMYRISMNGHVQFDKIADNKANILLSVNAIIISILLGTLLPEFINGRLTSLIIPFGILLLTSLFTMALAIIATIPKKTKKYVDRTQFKSQYGELLFFENFHSMSLEEYVQKMRVFQENDKSAYDALSQNFYILGKALAVKYKYLYLGYRVFSFGFIISVAAFLIILAQSDMFQ